MKSKHKRRQDGVSQALPFIEGIEERGHLLKLKLAEQVHGLQKLHWNRSTPTQFLPKYSSIGPGQFQDLFSSKSGGLICVKTRVQNTYIKREDGAALGKTFFGRSYPKIVTLKITMIMTKETLSTNHLSGTRTKPTVQNCQVTGCTQREMTLVQ